MSKKQVNNDIPQEFFSEKERQALLIELSSTPYWKAIIEYFQLRKNFILQSLTMIDPIADAYKIAKLQGGLQGMADLPEYVSILRDGGIKGERQDNME